MEINISHNTFLQTNGWITLLHGKIIKAPVQGPEDTEGHLI